MKILNNEELLFVSGGEGGDYSAPYSPPPGWIFVDISDYYDGGTVGYWRPAGGWGSLPDHGGE